MPAPQSIGRYPKAMHRVVASLGHLSILPSAGLFAGMGAFLLPLAWWIAFRRMSPLVDHHARFSLNAAITFSLIAAVFQALDPWGRVEHVPLLVIGGIVVAVWGIVILRRAWRAWRARDLHQPRFSWVG